MSKIIDSTALGVNTPKVVELLDELCINGQIYDKSSLIPKPLEFLSVKGLGTDIYFNTQCYTGKHNTSQFSTNCILVDENNSKYTYVAMNTGTGTRIVKIFTEGKSREVVATIYESEESNKLYNTEFFAQDETSVYIVLQSGAASCHIGKINKNTNAVSWTSVLNNGCIKLVFEHGGFFYYTLSDEKNKFSIGKYNKITGAISTVHTDNGTVVSNGNFRVIPTDVKSDNSFYVARNDQGFGGSRSLIIKRYVFDAITDSFTSVAVNMDLNLLPTKLIEVMEVNQISNQYTMYESCGVDGTEYLTLISNRYDGKMYLFEKTSSTSLVLKQVCDLTTTYDSVIPYNQNKCFIALKANVIYFYNFNEVDKKYELTCQLNKDYKRFGIDNNQNLWIQLKDNSIEAISNVMPVKIEALFDQRNFEYSNEEIETIAKVYATDFKGGMAVTQLKLTIIGPAYFSSTNEKTITVTTTSKSITQVPVKITGSGFVKILTEIV